MRTMLLGLLASTALATRAAAADVRSISRIAFGPDNTVFVADWKAARIHALRLTPAAPAAARPFNVRDLRGVLARSVGVPVVIDDMAARPGTGQVYVAFDYGAARTPALAQVLPDGSVRRVDLRAAAATSVALADAPNGRYAFWGEIPERSFTVTDMTWHGGELFVAGLSNQEFASTLRRVHYPFDGRVATTSVEIYHASHNQIETRAPIRAMTIVDLGGDPYLVAAYTCTPLVSIPLAALTDGAHVRGKTLAELGYGNTPSGMITYARSDNGKSAPYVLLTNYERSSDLVPVAAVQAANTGAGLTEPVPFGMTRGLDPVQLPFAGVTRVDNLDDQFLVAVRNDAYTGQTQLVTIDKRYQFRVSDFVSEYNFPGYRYSADFQAKYIRPVQDTLKRQEGFGGAARP
jgi:hypothetical protein